MTSIVRAPFYVPRPADDTYWSGAPIDSAAIQLTTTQVKFYGQPGQAPTKQWRYDLDTSDPWYATPIRSLIGVQTGLGNYPNHRQWHYDFDDATVWYASPQRSYIIAELNFKPFTLRAEVPKYDDASVWQWQPPRIPTPSVSTPTTARAWAYNWDEASPWLQPYQRTKLTPNTFGFNLRWTFGSGWDDATFWSIGPHNAFFTQTFPKNFGMTIFGISKALDIPADTPTSYSSISSNSIINLLPPPVAGTLIQRTLTGVGI